VKDVDAGVLFDRQYEPLAILDIHRVEPFDRQCRHALYVNVVELIMADVPDIPRPSQLWKRLPPEQKQQAAEAFWSDDNAVAEQADAVAVIAQRLKFRMKSVVALPLDKKVRHLVALPLMPELVAARLLVAYHLAHQRPMMTSFLDALGIKHENGLIEEEDTAAPSPERLQAAAKTIAESFPPEDVALYLSTLVWQDPDTWGGLAEAPETRAAAS
jgi:hypothetical protein